MMPARSAGTAAVSPFLVDSEDSPRKPLAWSTIWLSNNPFAISSKFMDLSPPLAVGDSDASPRRGPLVVLATHAVTYAPSVQKAESLPNACPRARLPTSMVQQENWKLGSDVRPSLSLFIDTRRADSRLGARALPCHRPQLSNAAARRPAVRGCKRADRCRFVLPPLRRLWRPGNLRGFFDPARRLA